MNKFTLSGYQKYILRKIENNQKIIIGSPRQTGVSSVIYYYIIKSVSCNEFENIAILHLHESQYKDNIDYLFNILKKLNSLINKTTNSDLHLEKYGRNLDGYRFDLIIIDKLYHSDYPYNIKYINDICRISDKTIINTNTTSIIDELKKDYTIDIFSKKDIDNIKTKERKDKLNYIFNNQ